MRISDWSSDVCSSDLLGHEIAPDARRQAAARNAAQRAVVVVADPHADDEAAGIADEQRVAIVLTGPCLAEIGDAEHRRAAGAVVYRRAQHPFHIAMPPRAAAGGARKDAAAPPLFLPPPRAPP